MDPIFFIGLAISLIAGFLISYYKINRPDELFEAILRHLIEKYIDARYFTARKIAEELDMTEDTVKKYLAKMEVYRIVSYLPDKNAYVLIDPLVFLTPKDYARALRITKDDKIIYGAYQAPYRINPIYIVIQLAIIIIPTVLLVLQIFQFADFRPYFGFLTWLGIDIVAFFLFLIALGIIIADAFNNLFKAYMRERYSVIVGEKSGIAYDVSFADEFSGRIRRGEIASVDLDVNTWQKLHNYFGEIPIGNARVRTKRGHEIVFKSIPFPRELFYAIRSIVLGNLAWRKRHAGIISMWKAGAIPTIGWARRRR